LQLALVTTHGLEGLYTRDPLAVQNRSQPLNKYWIKVTANNIKHIVSDFHRYRKCGAVHGI
jgi:hypothetical protein